MDGQIALPTTETGAKSSHYPPSTPSNTADLPITGPGWIYGAFLRRPRGTLPVSSPHDAMTTTLFLMAPIVVRGRVWPESRPSAPRNHRGVRRSVSRDATVHSAETLSNFSVWADIETSQALRGGADFVLTVSNGVAVTALAAAIVELRLTLSSHALLA